MKNKYRITITYNYSIDGRSFEFTVLNVEMFEQDVIDLQRVLEASDKVESVHVDLLDPTPFINQAKLISELLCNVGWMDNADRLIGEILNREGQDAAIKKQKEVNKLIKTINVLLPIEEQIKPIKVIR